MPPRSRESALAPFQSQLGRVPDQEIADRAGVSRALVVNYRKKLGINAYDGYRAPRGETPLAAPKEFHGRRSALDPYVDLLGKVSDAEIARRAGVTPENVRAFRQRRGIPSQAENGHSAPIDPPDRPAPTSARPAPEFEGLPAPTPAPEPPARSVPTAFLVIVDTAQGSRSYALVASDIAEAARAAVARVTPRHPDATIRSIQRVAELLP